jgi:hypothetical protein
MAEMGRGQLRRRTLTALLLIGLFSVLASLATPAQGTAKEEGPTAEATLEEVNQSSVTYGVVGSSASPTASAAGPSCTVHMYKLDIIGVRAESHLEQGCTRYLTQRLSKHNWQRQRWWGWETLVWREPATAWRYDNYIDDYNYFSCLAGSGTYNYRSRRSRDAVRSTPCTVGLPAELASASIRRRL